MGIKPHSHWWLLALFAPGLLQAQTIDVLHSFSPLVLQTNIQGDYPAAGLILSGQTLYGTTSSGGLQEDGTIFKVNTDGSGYAGLYSFQGGTNGSFPSASLVLVGDTLYGTTYGGGAASNGTVFAINTNGSAFRILHSFPPLDASLENSDGATPQANLVWSGQMLYGTASSGGANGAGSIFAISTNGLVFTNLYSFSGLDDGGSPMAGLTLSDGVLYGTTSAGGTNFSGSIFSIPTNGGAISKLYDFHGSSDGSEPDASLVLSGNTLYGTAGSGGSNFAGVVFAVNTDGSAFTNLHTFGAIGDGSAPQAGLILLGDTLFGTTSEGGATNNGTVFAINTDGSAYTNLHSFSALNTNFDNPDGQTPVSALVASGNALFGTARYGGAYDFGTVFTLATNGAAGSFTTLVSFDIYEDGLVFDANDDGASPQGGVLLAGGALYGTANGGGNWGGGVIFSMQANGSNFTTLHNFAGPTDGSSPQANLILASDILYGATKYGGQFGNGVIYSIQTNGSAFTPIYSFSSLAFGSFPFTNTDGANPAAGLVLSNNVLYGTASSGGDFGEGAVFALTTDGLHFTNLHSFTALNSSSQNNDGATPMAGLVLSNGILYGTTKSGGSASAGTIFAVGADGAGFTNLYTFTNGADGANPTAPLLLTNGLLYGTTPTGGATGAGALFSLGLDGSNFTVVHAFTGGGDGSYSAGGLIGDQVYVPMAFGGTSFAGAIFSMNLDGTGMLGISMPGGAEGSYPNGQMSLLGNGAVAVAAQQGGASSEGAILAVSPGSLLPATLENAGANVAIPEGGSGAILAPIDTPFAYTFLLGSDLNPASLTAVGPVPAGLNSISENTSTGQWTFSGDFTQNGTFPVTVEAQEGASAFFYTVNVEVCNPPTVTNVVAANTNALPNVGDQIIITGTGLSAVTLVIFTYPVYASTNGIPATNIVVNSDNQITVTIPPGATTGPIGVFASCGYHITTPAVIIGSMPAITLSAPALMPGNIFQFNLSGPVGTYQFLTSTDLVHWKSVSTYLMQTPGDPSFFGFDLWDFVDASLFGY